MTVVSAPGSRGRRAGASLRLLDPTRRVGTRGRPARCHTRNRADRRADDPGRDRRRHGPLPHAGASDLLGAVRPRGQRVRRPQEGQRRHRQRRGKKRAIVAVGRSILVIIWVLLPDTEAQFVDLGADYYTTRTIPERRVRHLIRELQALGYTVTLDPATCSKSAGILGSGCGACCSVRAHQVRQRTPSGPAGSGGMAA